MDSNQGRHWSSLTTGGSWASLKPPHPSHCLATVGRSSCPPPTSLPPYCSSHHPCAAAGDARSAPCWILSFHESAVLYAGCAQWGTVLFALNVLWKEGAWRRLALFGKEQLDPGASNSQLLHMAGVQLGAGWVKAGVATSPNCPWERRWLDSCRWLKPACLSQAARNKECNTRASLHVCPCTWARVYCLSGEFELDHRLWSTP